ncbi:MAG: hypothetical protein KC505_09340 [Myxococcales bacterium]|nr:hypothetical protein [Myxococcales bacterium]
MMVKKILSSALVLFSAVAVNLQADFVSPENKARGIVTSFPLTVAKPFAVFKSVGAKYPYMLRFDPAQNTFTSVMCGALDDESPRLSKKAEDLENIVPIRITVKALDAGIQIDRIYQGYRESYIGCFLEAMLTTCGILPHETYPGTFIIDEMQDGVAMKWVFQNLQEFKAFKAYVEKKVAQGNLTFSSKPHLLVEILKGGIAGLDASDHAFLNQHFTLVDPADDAIMDFYNRAAAIMTDITTCGVDFGNAAENFGLKFMRLIEKDCSGFKVPDMLADGAKLAFTALTTAILVKLFMDYIAKPAQDGAANAVGRAGNAIKERILPAQNQAV